MIEIPSQFEPEFISKNFFPKYYPARLGAINNGECYDWAYYAHRLFSNTNLWSTDYHAWIEKDGFHYDSEAPGGVIGWENLRTNTFWSGTPMRQSLEEFKEFWNQHGGGKKRHWDSILEKHMEIVLGDFYIPLNSQLNLF